MREAEQTATAVDVGTGRGGGVVVLVGRGSNFFNKGQDTIHLSSSTVRAVLFPQTDSGLQMLKIWKSVCHDFLVQSFVKQLGSRLFLFQYKYASVGSYFSALTTAAIYIH